MFHFKNKIKNARKEREKKNYDLTYENLAIPEIHTHEAEEPVDREQKETDQKPEVVYDSVAIPEVHIRKKK